VRFARHIVSSKNGTPLDISTPDSEIDSSRFESFSERLLQAERGGRGRRIGGIRRDLAVRPANSALLVAGRRSSGQGGPLGALAVHVGIWPIGSCQTLHAGHEDAALVDGSPAVLDALAGMVTHG
jgi:hypothetical protein